MSQEEGKVRRHEICWNAALATPTGKPQKLSIFLEITCILQVVRLSALRELAVFSELSERSNRTLGAEAFWDTQPTATIHHALNSFGRFEPRDHDKDHGACLPNLCTPSHPSSIDIKQCLMVFRCLTSSAKFFNPNVSSKSPPSASR
jgi:hypothetical protein